MANRRKHTTVETYFERLVAHLSIRWECTEQETAAVLMLELCRKHFPDQELLFRERVEEAEPTFPAPLDGRDLGAEPLPDAASTLLEAEDAPEDRAYGAST